MSISKDQLYNTFERLSVSNIPLEVSFQTTSAFKPLLLSNFRYWSPDWRDVDFSYIADLPSGLNIGSGPAFLPLACFPFMVLLVGIMSPASELSDTPKHIIFFVEVTCLMVGVHHALQLWKR